MKTPTLAGRFTLIQQWMAATILAVIPLLIAVGYAVTAFQHQTRTQQTTVEQVDLFNKKSSAVSENVRELVRLARQYQLLGDRSFLELYRQKLTTLQDNLAPLRAPALDDRIGDALDTVDNRLRAVASQLTGIHGNSEQVAGDHLEAAVQAADTIAAEVSRHRQETVQTGEEQFNRIVDQLFYLAVLALPGTLLLMLVGNYMVSRPIWRLSQAIKRLGTQNWETPITIRGPSDLVALGDNLEWMRKEVLRSEQQKTAFIQHVTHELKTPLAAIIEAGNLLDEEVAGPLQEGQRDILGILRNNSRALQELIEQLLNYNAVSYGISTHLEEVRVRDICDSICRGLTAASPNKDIDWHIEGEPETLMSDNRLLEMILKNLMSNAFQFSPGGRRIAVTWQAREKDWQIAVADQGPGIAEDEVEHIFTPFFKGRTGREDKIPKNGIGLAIVSESVSLLGGTIDTDSEPGQGTTFTITFPLQRPPSQP